MPNRDKNKNTGKKHSVLRDELGIKGPGIYAFTPFENIDSKRRSVIKIGESGDLVLRSSQYATYFPGGVYMVGFLTSIKGKLPLRNRKNNEKQKPRQIREEIEQFVMDYVSTHDNGKRVYSTDRVRRPNGTLEGQTEWVFSRVENVHAALEEAGKIYRAKVHLYYLQGKNPDTGELENIQQQKGRKKMFTGEVAFY